MWPLWALAKTASAAVPPHNKAVQCSERDPCSLRTYQRHARAAHLNCEKQNGNYQPLYGLNKSEDGFDIPPIPIQCDGTHTLTHTPARAREPTRSAHACSARKVVRNGW
jgi:hypothetical protein